MPQNKRTIPEIRARLYELANELGINELSQLADETYRSSPVRRAPRKSLSLTPALAAKIRIFARKNPKMHQRQIAEHFNVNPGRVSEAMNNIV
jgi:DNA-binding MarR family transcriptional regulator